MPDPQDDHRYLDPPHGFVVLRESDLDPEQGRHDRWICRGVVGGRTVIKTGLGSRASACRVAWFAADDARVKSIPVEYAHEDVAVAEALASKHAVHREMAAAWPRMRDEYTVRLDSWDHMEASLFAQVVADAGSIRKASKIIDMPRSTLSARVRKHQEKGTRSWASSCFRSPGSRSWTGNPRSRSSARRWLTCLGILGSGLTSGGTSRPS